MGTAMMSVFLLCLLASLIVSSDAYAGASRVVVGRKRGSIIKRLFHKGNVRRSSTPDGIKKRQACYLYRDERFGDFNICW
ncbi:hypothetical protein AC249_AIPGENE9633 [Exaiptasia diaphana]|nr:hypothetical protein AC249_AIPGENE9633 [Exaiptasia diaphana]